MADREFLRFINNDENINYDAVLVEVKNMSFVSASRIGRVVDEEDVKEISSCFLTFLWEEKCKGHFPMQEEVAFAKLKRFIYDLCSAGRTVGGFDEKIESDALSYTTKKEFPKELFLSEFENLHLPSKIKTAYQDIVDQADPDTLLELSEKNNFLGNLLVAFLMRPHGRFKSESIEDDYSLFKIKGVEEEIYLACLVVKLGKFWPYCSFVLWGQNLFTSVASFMGPVLVPNYEKYFKNLFLSVKVFTTIESFKSSYDEVDAMRETSWRLSIRMRDVIRRYEKVKRILGKYDQITEFYATELLNNYKELFREEKQQLTLFDVKEVSNG